MTDHIVLIGDSIFDNASYVPDGPSVIEHVTGLLPRDWAATLVAVDGATAATTLQQIQSIPDDATHLVLSVGGNDALGIAIATFGSKAENIRHALQLIERAVQSFNRSYEDLIEQLKSKRLPLAICTVYDHVPGLDASEAAGLCVFNDRITRTAFEIGATLIDLRLICDDASDYSEVSPIEPSASGGEKIATAIVKAVVNGSKMRGIVA